jgi:hypothetical protein
VGLVRVPCAGGPRGANPRGKGTCSARALSSDRPPGSPRKCTTATGAGWGRGGMHAWLVEYARGQAGGALAGLLAGWAAGVACLGGARAVGRSLSKLATKSVASESLAFKELATQLDASDRQRTRPAGRAGLS